MNNNKKEFDYSQFDNFNLDAQPSTSSLSDGLTADTPISPIKLVERMFGTKEQFPFDEQRGLLNYMISDQTAFEAVRYLIKPEYFDGSLVGAVKYIFEYNDQFNTVPSVEQIHIKCRVILEKFSEPKAHDEWFLETINQFCRYKALQNCALTGIDLIMKGRYDEYQHLINDAMNVGLGNDEDELMSIDDVLAIKPPEWLLDEMVPEKSLVVLYGPPGKGKSFLVLGMGLTLAYGREWRGVTQPKKSVVYVAAEGASGLGVRVAAWRAHHGLANVSTDHFALLPRPVSLMDAAATQKLIAMLKKREKKTGIPTDLVVIDTLARSMVGVAENQTEAMGVAVEHADTIKRELGCAVILIHHSGKDLDRGARGSNSLKGAADAELCVARTSPTTMSVYLEKMKDAEDGYAIEFKVHTVPLPHLGTKRNGKVVDSLVVVPDVLAPFHGVAARQDVEDAMAIATHMEPGKLSVSKLCALLADSGVMIKTDGAGYSRIKAAVTLEPRLITTHVGKREIWRTESERADGKSQIVIHCSEPVEKPKYDISHAMKEISKKASK